MIRRRKGRVKWGESSLASNLSVLHSLEHPERFTELCREEKRRGRKEIEVTWRRKGRVKRGESNQTSNHTPN